ncbi:uncharacterized protein [Haliotis cracherodii]|uniref:uncharacterized protein n=1 Tax=Haliotis cracherodii TaxID=6455 RepID=UPI0039E90609
MTKIQTTWDSWANIYTDGSKNPINISAGYRIHIHSSKPQAHSVCLPDGQSVFTAELEAIHHALKLIQELLEARAVVLSDSLSALQAISGRNSNSRPNTVNNILFEYTKLSDQGQQVELCWIPSHLGIHGDETVDSLAKLDTKTKRRYS